MLRIELPNYMHVNCAIYKTIKFGRIELYSTAIVYLTAEVKYSTAVQQLLIKHNMLHAQILMHTLCLFILYP